MLADLSGYHIKLKLKSEFDFVCHHMVWFFRFFCLKISGTVHTAVVPNSVGPLIFVVRFAYLQYMDETHVFLFENIMLSGGRPVPGCLAQGGHAGQAGEEPAHRLSQGNICVEQVTTTRSLVTPTPGKISCAGVAGEEPAHRLSQGNSRVESSSHYAESGSTYTR
jgi:hypothetical protein